MKRRDNIADTINSIINIICNKTYKILNQYIYMNNSIISIPNKWQIFLCFSSVDRHDIVEAILYHLSNYALPIWYDRYKMLLGDARDQKNFIEGIGESSYAIIVLSENALLSPCVKEEIGYIFDKYKKKAMTVFPIFFNIAANNIPPCYNWLTKLVYKELKTNQSVLPTCNHIMCRILADELKNWRFTSIEKTRDYFRSACRYSYLAEVFDAYCITYKGRLNARLALLYSVALYIKEQMPSANTPSFFLDGMRFLFHEIALNLKIDRRELRIMEHLLLLYLNYSLVGVEKEYP